EGSSETPVLEQSEPAPQPATPVEASAPEAGDAAHGVKLFGELLFLKPTLDDTYFAIASPTAAGGFPQPLSGTRVNDDFDYEPAFRIGADYKFPDTGRTAELSYTRLAAEATETVTGSHLWATRGTPDFV